VNKPIRIAVTGAAGQIGYSLLFRLASGEVFGKDTPVILHLIELPQAIQAAEGVAMELHDCAFESLHAVEIFDNPTAGFEGVHWALLVGSSPRRAGMLRKELISINAPIFVDQGKALLKADTSIRCVVVGNPCNTNALIALSHAQDIPSSRFYAMTALDETRAKYQLADKAGCSVKDVRKLAIWGNHSNTMVPDYENTLINGKPLREMIQDETWLNKTFMSTVQERGAQIIQARGKSSAASAASACIHHLKAATAITPADDVFSAAVLSDNNPYDIASGLVFSFPLQFDHAGNHSIYPGLAHSSALKDKIRHTEQDLLNEREVVKDFLTS